MKMKKLCALAVLLTSSLASAAGDVVANLYQSSLIDRQIEKLWIIEDKIWILWQEKVKQ